MEVVSQTCKELRDVEFDVELASGEVINMMVNAAPLFDDQGNVRGAVGAHVDVTRLKRAEAALREAARNKDDFLAMLGHELRNPLTLISTAVQLLRRKGPPVPELNELRDTIERQVGQMSQILDELLDLARIARGQIRLQKEPCDLSAIVQRVAEDHRVMLEESGIDLLLALPEKPVWVFGDRTRLAQILGNLLHNARKFTDSGGSVTVELCESSRDRSALLTVQDTGIGMDTEMLAHAFEPFVQGNGSIQRSQGGLGLGLALVKGLVELHDGKLSAFSKGHDQGCAISMHLPVTSPPATPLDID